MLTPLTGRADKLHSGGAVNPCDECGTEYRSPLAAAECADMDRAEDARQRAWVRTPQGAGSNPKGGR